MEPAAPTPASEQKEGVAPAAPSNQLTAAQQAEIDRIMAEAKAKAQQVILGGSYVAETGTPSHNVEEQQEKFQADHLPGSRRRDKTYVPEIIWDEKMMQTRRVLRTGEVAYLLVSQDDFLTYTGLGYKFVKFDGGPQSGLLNAGFQNTGEAIFRRTLDGNCQRGDCFLMWIPIRAWEAIRAEDRSRAEAVDKKALGAFHNAAYSAGIRPFAKLKDQDQVESTIFD